MSWRSHGIQGQVDLPTEKLHEEHPGYGVYGSLLEKFMVINEAGSRFWWEAKIGSSVRNVVLVAFDGNSGLVMSMMCRFPGEVRCKNELKNEQSWILVNNKKKTESTYSVKKISCQVVEPFVGRDIAVTSLVSHTPPSSENDTLADPIDGPAGPFGDRTSIYRGAIVVHQSSSKRFNLPSKLVDHYRRYDIPGDVRCGSKKTFFEQMLWHDGMDLGDSDLRARQSTTCSNGETELSTLVGEKGLDFLASYS